MADMLENPNIGAVVVERLPCAFAPLGKNGEPGTHYAMVLLDNQNNVVYVGSECEHKHGEGIQAIYEMGGYSGDVCFAAADAFRKGLRTIHQAKGSIISYREEPKGDGLPSILKRVLRSVWQDAADKHNTRIKEQNSVQWPDDLPGRSFKIKALQNALDRTLASILKLPALPDNWKESRVDVLPESRVDVLPEERIKFTNVRWPRIFTIEDRFFSKHEVQYEMTDKSVINGVKLEGDENRIVMYPSGFSMPKSKIFAVRDEQSRWSFDADRLKSWAQNHHNPFTDEISHALKLDIHRYCVFCQAEFDRMSRHTSGGKHIDRVVEIAQLGCKATTKLGLKLLNSPKHRSVFIKDR